jgi:hypothetical protein
VGLSHQSLLCPAPRQPLFCRKLCRVYSVHWGNKQASVLWETDYHVTRSTEHKDVYSFHLKRKACTTLAGAWMHWQSSERSPVLCLAYVNKSCDSQVPCRRETLDSQQPQLEERPSPWSEPQGRDGSEAPDCNSKCQPTIPGR